MKKIFSIAVFVLTFISLSFAQQAKKPAATPFAKFKPPVVKTLLSKFSGSTATCSAEEGKKIITEALKVTDEKNGAYTITSYQFAYKRLGVTENEETGEITPAHDMVAQRFTETPLPQLWLTNITEQLHKGEEFYFFDVIVKDKQGRLFFAPELKISIQ